MEMLVSMVITEMENGFSSLKSHRYRGSQFKVAKNEQREKVRYADLLTGSPFCLFFIFQSSRFNNHQ